MVSLYRLYPRPRRAEAHPFPSIPEPELAFSAAFPFPGCATPPDAGYGDGRPRRTLAAVLLVSILAVVPPPASAGTTEKSASKEFGKPAKAAVNPASATVDRSDSPPAAVSNKLLPVHEGSATPQSQTKQALPTAPARNPSDSDSKAESCSPSVDGALAKFEQLVEKAYLAFGTASKDSAKADAPSQVTATADQITSGPGNTITFRGHVKISLSGAVLEAERVVIDLSSKPSEKESPKAVVTAVGKYRMTVGKILLLGRQKNSKLEIREDGTPHMEFFTMKRLP